MKVINIATMKENEEYKLNNVYYSEKVVSVNGAKFVKKVWDAEFECKREKTAMNRIAKAVPELDWVKDFEPENAEVNGMLSSEYDSFTIESFDGTVYIAVCMWEQIPEEETAEEQEEVVEIKEAEAKPAWKSNGFREFMLVTCNSCGWVTKEKGKIVMFSCPADGTYDLIVDKFKSLSESEKEGYKMMARNLE